MHQTQRTFLFQERWLSKCSWLADEPMKPRRLQRNSLPTFRPESRSSCLLFFLTWFFWTGYMFSENTMDLNSWTHQKYNSIQNSVCFLTKQEDYIETDDKKVFPLRWTAPELVTSFQDRLLTADQTKYSNIWYVLAYCFIRHFFNKVLTSSSLSTFLKESSCIRCRNKRVPDGVKMTV